MKTNHPNTVTAGGVGTLTTLVVAGFEALGANMTPTVAAAVATAAITVALFVGKRGVKGVIRLVWRGDGNGAGE